MFSIATKAQQPLNTNPKLQLATIMEKVEKFLSTEAYLKKEILKAKEMYGERVGKLQEQNPLYQQKNRSFFYWFLFDWAIKLHASSYHRYLHSSVSYNKPEYRLEKQLIRHEYSIFKLLKVTKKHSLVRDLYSKKKYKILDTDSMVGIEKNTLFETRLFSLNQEYCFADYFICHPIEVSSVIYKNIKLLRGKDKEYKDFILTLQYFYTMWKRSTINIRLIYKLNS